ncbi:MAG: amidohydrolase [Proteobacteria bacterium]|nr:amidohydrolase [Pseudomonadota bacterium]
MQIDDMVLVSVDDHVCEPPDMWDDRLPAKWRERAPRLVHKSPGRDVWVLEGRQIPHVGLNAVAGRPPVEYGMEPTALSQLREGCYDVDARIADMNANGVLGSLCFGSVPGFVGELFAKQDDKEMALAMIQAYNDWHIDGWCGAYPGRFIPLALPIMWDPKQMAEEVRRVARKGCHATTFPDTPGGLGYPSLHSDYWEPFWQACDENGTIVCIHIGSGTGMSLQDPSAPVEIMIASTPISLYNCATELTFSTFLRRYSNLKIALSEGGTGWIPYFLERADYVYDHHRHWTLQSFGDQKPSDVFREHIVTCFIDDLVGVRNRDLIGIENITWECDYPHSDTTWPRAPETLWRSLEGLPDADIDRITHLNAMRHFQYDPFVHVPRERATVGALRAQAEHVDLSPKRGGGGKTPSDYATGYATIGDIMKQMATAFSTPFDDSGAGMVEDPEEHVRQTRDHTR